MPSGVCCRRRFVRNFTSWPGDCRDICLIRLEQIRPSGVPAFLGWKSENAAHRIAVEWTDADCQNRRGVFIVRRDTNSLVNVAAGGHLFPGQHHRAKFEVQDQKGNVDVAAQSADGQMFAVPARFRLFQVS